LFVVQLLSLWPHFILFYFNWSSGLKSLFSGNWFDPTSMLFITTYSLSILSAGFYIAWNTWPWQLLPSVNNLASFQPFPLLSVFLFFFSLSTITLHCWPHNHFI
jgi:hypothetical protein